MTKKKFPLKYYLADIWDGKNILVDEVIADVKQIHADGLWPEECIAVDDMVAMIEDLAPEYALALNHHKHDKGGQTGIRRSFDINYWVMIVADPSHDLDMWIMNGLRMQQNLPASCMLMSSDPAKL